VLEAPATTEQRSLAAKPGHAFLLHPASQTRFPLDEQEENGIGRRDPVTGLAPLVDLGPVDPQKTTSRRHATLFFRDGQWYLREEVGVRNGTFVNGRRLQTGEAHPISSGDRLRFGLVEVEFHTG
ncbi:MAG: FHA domain-containing protein, partial [Thermoanaerobaculum sp.]|nr:FHA domain-containing protein [Thermoanaerobaculum sp.]